MTKQKREIRGIMNKTLDKEIYVYYISSAQPVDDICKFWDITKEELWRIVDSQKLHTI